MSHEVTQWDLAEALDVGGSSLQPHDVACEAKLGGVFDGDDPLAGGDHSRQKVEESRLA